MHFVFLLKIKIIYAPVAQLDRAPSYELGGLQVQVLSGVPVTYLFEFYLADRYKYNLKQTY